MALGKKDFMQKNSGSTLYKWSPQPNDLSKKQSKERPYYCNATSGSKGQDWIVTYAYNIELINYEQSRFAYTECDYVE